MHLDLCKHEPPPVCSICTHLTRLVGGIVVGVIEQVNGRRAVNDGSEMQSR
jgi:hypothetical protein